MEASKSKNFLMPEGDIRLAGDEMRPRFFLDARRGLIIIKPSE
jgi:hypothetical protein